MSTFLEDKEKLGYETHEDLLGHVCRDVDSVKVKKGECLLIINDTEPA